MRFAIYIVTAIGCLTALEATAAPEKLEPLHVHCTTAGTGTMGEGRNCSDVGCVSAPAGYVIIRDSYQISETSNNGGWHSVAFSDPVEIVAGTGITAPRKVCISVGANSEGGMTHAGSRGWEDVVGNGSISKYK